jgi:hypothetical protein
MKLPATDLKPAIRNPKNLRNTALVLLGMIVCGGCLVLLAYEKWSRSQATDNRPAIIYRITKERDLRMLRQDGKMADLADLRGHVIALNVLSLKNPQAAERSMAVMQRLAQNRATESQLNLISLMIDPAPAGELKPLLEQAAASRGIAMPQWWLGSNEPTTLHKFIKNELKASIYPNNHSGTWEYDSAIVLIDKNGHIRRAVVPQKQGGPPFIANFDFNQAAGWDERGVKTGTDSNNAEELEKLLNQTLEKLLAEPAKDS